VEAYTAILADHAGAWEAYRGRGDAELGLGLRAEAMHDYDKGMQLRPKDPGILNNLAWLLATAPEENIRNGKRAVVLATEACKLTDYKQAHILSTLAAAHAETGDFKEAEKWAAKAVEIGSTEHGDQLKKELESYQAGKPWREALPAAEEKKPPEQKPQEKK
jgi:Flp pilus assembly protein TadD